MKIICHTNIDKWKRTEWPKEFVTPPLVGDHIEGIGPGDYKPRLRVVDRTHGIWDHKPCLFIELHVPAGFQGASLSQLGWDKE